MTFNIRTELFIDGSWVDVSGDVYNRDPVQITRGRPDEASTADPSSCRLTLNNRDGRYSPRNPRSPYFGKLGRNTPIRVTLPDYGTSIFRVDASTNSAAEATSPDSAGLSITGDLDIRVDMALVDWDAAGTSVLVGKDGGTSGNYGWLFGFGYPTAMIPFFQWSANGTFNTLKSGTAPFDFADGARGCVRMTMDVDNGSGGNTITFYQGETMNGPWTMVGSPVVTAGTTALFDTTAGVRFGYNGGYPLVDGDYYGFQIRNGIGGAVVANPDFTAAGSPTSLTDDYGNTWTVTDAELTISPSVRFEGEVVNWPQHWIVDGADAWTPISAAGISRRLNQGSQVLDSPLFSSIVNDSKRAFPLGVAGYWPMEDDEGADKAYSPLPGVSTADANGFHFGQDAPIASAPLPQATTGSVFNALVPAYTPTANSWAVSWLMYLPETPAPSSDVALMRIRSTGRVTRHNIWFTNTGQVKIAGYRSDPNEGLHGDDEVYSNTSTNAFVPTGRWFVAEFRLTPSGSNIFAGFFVSEIGSSVSTGVDDVYVGTAGAVTRIYNTGWPAELDGMGIGHLTAYENSSGVIFQDAATAFDGETVNERIARLAEQTATTVTVETDEPALALMGPQPQASFLDALEECAATDGGALYESRADRTLVYRARDSIYNQAPVLTMTYGQAGPPLLPVDDDQHIHNDVTVSRYSGTKARHVDTTSPLSTQAPPLGVGRYDMEVQTNLHESGDIAAQAEWLVHLGTWDESRYPVVRVDLAARPELAADAINVDVLDRIHITDMPAWLPPDDVELLVQGYTETLTLTSWEIEFNCSPARPWDVGVLDDADMGRADTDGSQLAATVTDTATSLTVAVTDGPLWTTSGAEFPFDVLVGGEHMTVTNIAGSTSPQTFTVTRSVNGFDLAHPAGTDVRLAQPARVAW